MGVPHNDQCGVPGQNVQRKTLTKVSNTAIKLNNRNIQVHMAISSGKLGIQSLFIKRGCRLYLFKEGYSYLSDAVEAWRSVEILSYKAVFVLVRLPYKI